MDKSALMLTIEQGDPEAAKALIAAGLGADSQVRDLLKSSFKTIMRAAENGDMQMLKWLMAAAKEQVRALRVISVRVRASALDC